MNSCERQVRAAFASVRRCVTVPENARLRRESFGGIAFDKLTGIMVELDREAMAMLTRVGEAGSVREDELAAEFSDHRRVHQVIRRLVDLGILAIASPASLTSGSAHAVEPDENSLSARWPRGPHLTAPETVHWAITYRCDQKCPDCYARRHSPIFRNELDTESAMRMVDKLARWGVFQLAIGGGEPFLRPDLARICEHAHQEGLVVHVTTGYHDLKNAVLQCLRESVSVIQIGLKHDKLLADPTGEEEKLSETVRKVHNMGIGIGANLMMSNTVIAHFDRLIDILAQSGLDRITFLRYKPPAQEEQWRSENPLPRIWLDFEQRLPDMLSRYSGIAFRIDCALSFLQRNLTPDDATSAGIRGCVAGERILALTPNGSVFPCSQLVGSCTGCGSILTDDTEEIWTRSDVMRRYRAFRDSDSFRGSRCGDCRARNHCGGCRVFADDRLGPDPGCPESILPEGDHSR